MGEVEKIEEKDGANKIKLGKKKREGPSTFYYYDDTSLNLDYVMIKKLSKLGVAPPIEYKELPKL